MLLRKSSNSGIKKGSEKYAGIVGLDYGMDGHPLKNLKLPNVEALRIMGLTTTYQFRADTKMVHRTELLKAVAPMQVFAGEKSLSHLSFPENRPTLSVACIE